MNATSVTQTRLRGYFEKYSGRAIDFVSLSEHFSEVKPANLNYHLKVMVNEGFLIKPKRGLYQKNPEFVSPEQKRAMVETHLRTNGSPVQKGSAWQPGDDALTEVVNPYMTSYLGQSFGASIVERMRGAGFTAADVRFVELLLQRTYPLSEQQRNQCEGVLRVEPTVPSLSASNGRSGSGSS